MSSLLSTGWRWLRRLGALERALCVLLLAVIVLAMTLQIVTRYVFGEPLVWVEETAGYAFIWTVFLGAAAGFKELRHIRIDTFVSRLPAAPQHAVRGVLYLLCTAAALTIAWYALDIMDVESRSYTIALPIELPRHLFYSLPLCVSTVSIAVTGVWLTLACWTSAATGRPIEAELDVIERRRADEALNAHG